MFVGHSLVIGATGSGKTVLVHKMAKEFDKLGVPLLVLTPFDDDTSWNADFITDNSDEFLNVVFNHKSCLVVVEEAGEFAGQYNKAMFKLATRGRHNGHICIFIAQKMKMVAENIRVNCQNLFLFKTTRKMCRILEEDFAVEGLERATTLKKYHCLAVIGDSDPVVLPPAQGFTETP